MDHIFDVAIIGAGPSGIAAAIHTTKYGIKAILIEKDSIIGGSALKAQVHTIGGNAGSFFSGISKKAWSQNIFHPQDLIDKYYDLLNNSTICLLSDYDVISIDVKDNNISSLLCYGVMGKKLIKAKIFIDASGVSTVEHLTGKKDSSRTDRCYLTALIGKVETVGGRCYSPEAKELLQDSIKRAKSEGNLDNDIEFLVMPTERGDIAYLQVSYDRYSDNMGQIMYKGLQKAVAYLQNFGFGFENVSIISFSKNIFYAPDGTSQARYNLTSDDVLTGRKFDDFVVSDINFNSHSKNDSIDDLKSFSISYATLMSSCFDNLLLCGRNIGVHSNAVKFIDNIPVHFATGKAAGIAAAIAITRDIKIEKVMPVEIISKQHSQYAKDVSLKKDESADKQQETMVPADKLTSFEMYVNDIILENEASEDEKEKLSAASEIDKYITSFFNFDELDRALKFLEDTNKTRKTDDIIEIGKPNISTRADVSSLKEEVFNIGIFSDIDFGLVEEIKDKNNIGKKPQSIYNKIFNDNFDETIKESDDSINLKPIITRSDDVLNMLYDNEDTNTYDITKVKDMYQNKNLPEDITAGSNLMTENLSMSETDRLNKKSYNINNANKDLTRAAVENKYNIEFVKNISNEKHQKDLIRADLDTIKKTDDSLRQFGKSIDFNNFDDILNIDNFN